jgi:hypothetical protein
VGHERNPAEERKTMNLLDNAKFRVSFAIAIAVAIMAMAMLGSESIDPYIDRYYLSSLDPYLTLLALIGFSLVLYFLPLIVAKTRDHRQVLAIGVLNVLAGWTLVGWVVALVWACIKPAPRDDSNGGRPFVDVRRF